jgi:NAD(P)-dependent dehydrogenase (short-subunit alcohol dehydrogenase family)
MMDKDLTGRTFVVTGSSTGVGLETSRALARRGATLAMASRDPARGKIALDDVRASSGNDALEFFAVDLSSMADTRRFAGVLLERYPSLDVLVHNAALAPLERTLTSEGIEPAIATNVIAPWLLTHLLRPALEKAPAPRVVFLNGAMAPIDLDDLNYTQGRFHPFTAYRRSKLAEHWVMSEFARRWADSKITVLAVNPGMVPSTTGFQTVPWWMKPSRSRAVPCGPRPRPSSRARRGRSSST